MDGWIDKSMGGWIDGLKKMDDWKRWIDGWMDRLKNIDVRMDGRMDGWVIGKDGCMYVWIKKDGWMEVLIDGSSSSFGIIRVNFLTKRLLTLSVFYLLPCLLITCSETTPHIYLLLLPSLLLLFSQTPPLSWSPLHSNPHITASMGEHSRSVIFVQRNLIFFFYNDSAFTVRLSAELCAIRN